MRAPFLFLVILFLSGCAESGPKIQPPDYRPETFRETVTELIRGGQYDVAVAYLESADPEQQVRYDEAGYIAVAQDLIVLPGVEIDYDRSRERDWVMPGTSDAVESMDWQRAATEFAKAYNLKRREDSQPKENP